MALFDLLFTAAEVALIALSIATMTVVALGGLIVGSASMHMRRSPRA